MSTNVSTHINFGIMYSVVLYYVIFIFNISVRNAIQVAKFEIKLWVTYIFVRTFKLFYKQLKSHHYFNQEFDVCNSIPDIL